MQVSSKLDETSRNQVWREHCRKEAKHPTHPSRYSITNPQHMDLLSEKPNKVSPHFVRPESADLREATRLLESISNAKNTYQVPSEVYASTGPLTSNMAYGFRSMACPPPQNPLFMYKRNSCDVTSYAATYACATGTSPFSKAARSAGEADKAATAKI